MAWHTSCTQRSPHRTQCTVQHSFNVLSSFEKYRAQWNAEFAWNVGYNTVPCFFTANDSQIRLLLPERVTFASWRLFNCQARKNNTEGTMSPEVLSKFLSQICTAGWNILTLPTLLFLKTTPFLKKMWKEWPISKTSTSCAILSAADTQTLIKYVIVTKCEFRQTSNQKS